MDTSSTNFLPSRFLDLPAEIRLLIYENIETRFIRHTLTRKEANIDTRNWPVLPPAHSSESQLTLIRPYPTFEILRTCRLIHEEAHKLLQRNYAMQPMRYVMDYNAARAVTSNRSPLRICLGGADGGISCGVRDVVKDFLQHCQSCLTHSRRSGCGGSRDLRAIEITISQKDETVYAKVILKFLRSLRRLDYYSPTRIVVVYRAALPEMLTRGNLSSQDPCDIAQRILRNLSRETENGHRGHVFRGVFLKPLDGKAFEEHERSLESY